MNIEQILRSPQTRVPVNDDNDPVKIFMTANKLNCAESDNETGAKRWALLEMIYTAQNNYLRVFKLLADKDYYVAWCVLERIEIAIKTILRHYTFIDDEYKILFIQEYVTKLQRLFPYKLFASSEFVKKEVRCSICNNIISLRNRCGHRKGEFYKGEHCSHLITNAEILAIAIVEKPFNKYSVANVTGKDNDPYCYPLIDYLLSIIDHPFNEWDTRESKILENHALYTAGRNDKCPCGSKLKYKKCCLKKAGVELPHTDFILRQPTVNTFGKIPTNKKLLVFGGKA